MYSSRIVRVSTKWYPVSTNRISFLSPSSWNMCIKTTAVRCMLDNKTTLSEKVSTARRRRPLASSGSSSALTFSKSIRGSVVMASSLVSTTPTWPRRSCRGVRLAIQQLKFDWRRHRFRWHHLHGWHHLDWWHHQHRRQHQRRRDRRCWWHARGRGKPGVGGAAVRRPGQAESAVRPGRPLVALRAVREAAPAPEPR